MIFEGRVELHVLCLGVLTYIAMHQAFEHGYKYICFVLVSNVHFLCICVFYIFTFVMFSAIEHV